MTVMRPDRGMQVQAYHGFGSKPVEPEASPMAQAVEHWLFQQGLLSDMPVDQPQGPLLGTPMAESGYTEEQTQPMPDIERLFNEMHQEERLQGGRPSEHQLRILDELGYPRTTGSDVGIQEAIAGMLGE